MNFFDELKRRNVFRVSAAYIVTAWVLAQVVDLILAYVKAPEWVMLVFMLFVAVGFVAAVIIAWAYEMTADGIKRESDVDHSQSIVADTGRKLDRIIIMFLALAVVLLLTDRYLRPPSVTAPPDSQVNVSAETSQTQRASEKSIAVLPFVNMSADADNEFFSDGISEEILNVLASIPELKVAARTSAFAYKGTNTSIPAIAAELGVAHVLEGSVRKTGNQVRVTAQLIKADDGFHVWSENYDRELTNIFAIQDEIAGSIAEAMKVSLNLATDDSGNLTGTNNIQAYEHYLQGMQLWHLRTVPALQQSLEEFEAAVKLDPNFAKAHAGLALYWAVIWGYMDIDEKVGSENAELSANRALELDPKNVESLSALGSVYGYKYEFDKASIYYERALQINPSFATAHQWYGGMLTRMGDADAGIASYRNARNLDPRSRIISYNLAFRLMSVGKNAEAIQIMEEVLEYAPNFPDGLDLMMQLKMVAGLCGEADTVAQHLAKVLKKTRPALQVYRDLCQDSDPGLRLDAAKTISTWSLGGFANPDHPALTYKPDTITLFLHYGLFDELLEFIRTDLESIGWFYWIRSYETENAILFRCDQRMQDLARQREIQPSVKPLVCD